MVQSKPQSKLRFATFEEYLAHSDHVELEGCHELIDAELVKVPPESEPNISSGNYLLVALIQSGVSCRLVHNGKCEIQVPIIRPEDPANRFPDLVVLRPEHLSLTQRRLTLTLDMAPPQLVVEIVSPGQENRDRDYIHKRNQYAARGIPEYWIIDPQLQIVTVLVLEGDFYREVGTFQGDVLIISPSFPELKLTPKQILNVE
jgi:Uma2 family endonuclease